MLFKISDLLSPEAVTAINKTLTQAEFVDGKLTAGWHAKLVKHNQQLKADHEQAIEIKQQIKTALQQHPLFQAAVRPKAIHSILLSRYDVGMSYGTHIDNALMGNTTHWRSDVSFTVFLSEPETYGGGELVIESADDERDYKLAAGSALLYPSTALHRVEPVTKGVRLVAVGWVQSYIREAHKRELLFDLETVKRRQFAQTGKSPEFDLLTKSIANLLRLWAE